MPYPNAQHNYEPNFFCNNYVAPNGRVYSGNCSHIKQFKDAHCLHCGKEKSNVTVHISESQ